MVTQMEAADILGEFIATRSPELREKLVLQSVPLVHYLLGRMGISQAMDKDYEDLAHQGLMGLIEAVDHFNPDVKTQFSTYAVLRIRGKIVDYLRASDWMPRKARKQSSMMQKAIFTLWSENMREPTEEELAAHLNITVEAVRQSLTDSNRILVSLDTVADKDEESLYDYFRDDAQEDPAEIVEQESLIEKMSSAIQNLSEREQLLLSLYYNDGLTFREIGKVLNVTESRVSQMHASAIYNLKAMMRDEQ
jgi:RNA polymerase sigma factor for flagellar operon FliA